MIFFFSQEWWIFKKKKKIMSDFDSVNIQSLTAWAQDYANGVVVHMLENRKTLGRDIKTHIQERKKQICAKFSEIIEKELVETANIVRKELDDACNNILEKLKGKNKKRKRKEEEEEDESSDNNNIVIDLTPSPPPLEDCDPIEIDDDSGNSYGNIDEYYINLYQTR